MTYITEISKVTSNIYKSFQSDYRRMKREGRVIANDMMELYPNMSSNIVYRLIANVNEKQTGIQTVDSKSLKGTNNGHKGMVIREFYRGKWCAWNGYAPRQLS